MVREFLRFVTDQKGASALEYTVFVAFFGMAMIVGLELMGVGLGSFFNGSAAYMEAKKPQ